MTGITRISGRLRKYARVRRLRTFAWPHPRCSQVRCTCCTRVHAHARFSLAEPRPYFRRRPLGGRLRKYARVRRLRTFAWPHPRCSQVRCTCCTRVHAHARFSLAEPRPYFRRRPLGGRLRKYARVRRLRTFAWPHPRCSQVRCTCCTRVHAHARFSLAEPRPYFRRRPLGGRLRKYARVRRLRTFAWPHPRCSQVRCTCCTRVHAHARFSLAEPRPYFRRRPLGGRLRKYARVRRLRTFAWPHPRCSQVRCTCCTRVHAHARFSLAEPRPYFRRRPLGGRLRKYARVRRLRTFAWPHPRCSQVRCTCCTRVHAHARFSLAEPRPYFRRRPLVVASANTLAFGGCEPSPGRTRDARKCAALAAPACTPTLGSRSPSHDPISVGDH